MGTLPIPAAIIAEYGPQVSRDVTDTSPWQPILIGFDNERAERCVRVGYQVLGEYFMRGDVEGARSQAQRIALARDALPTPAERNAVRYTERLARSLAALTHRNALGSAATEHEGQASTKDTSS